MDQNMRDALDKATRIAGAAAADEAVYVLVRHPDAFGCSTGKPMEADSPPPEPGPVNEHPGPDLDVPEPE